MDKDSEKTKNPVEKIYFSALKKRAVFLINKMIDEIYENLYSTKISREKKIADINNLLAFINESAEKKLIDDNNSLALIMSNKLMVILKVSYKLKESMMSKTASLAEMAEETSKQGVSKIAELYNISANATEEVLSSSKVVDSKINKSIVDAIDKKAQAFINSSELYGMNVDLSVANNKCKAFLEFVFKKIEKANSITKSQVFNLISFKIAIKRCKYIMSKTNASDKNNNDETFTSYKKH